MRDAAGALLFWLPAYRATIIIKEVEQETAAIYRETDFDSR